MENNTAALVGIIVAGIYTVICCGLQWKIGRMQKQLNNIRKWRREYETN